MKFQFLVENKTDGPGVLAEHGLSIYIEAKGKKILFDAGASDLVMTNAENLQVDLSQVDLAVVSHGHYDHTGGFPAFCHCNHKAPIYLQKNGFRKSYGFEHGELEAETCGIRWTDQQREELADRLSLTDGPMKLDEDIYLTGTVPIAEGFVPTEQFYYYDETGELVVDDLSHEQCLVIREPEGLYIFSGCSHRGAVSALECGKSMFPGEPVAVFVAGMHLYGADEIQRNRVVEQIAAEDIGRIMPVHCTGIQAICQLKSILGERCIAATTGACFYGR